MENKTFEKNVTDIWGQTGKTWLKNLPEIIVTLSNTWNFEKKQTFTNLTYSCVTRVSYMGKTAVLKITPPCERTTREIAWYKIQAPRGCPKLLYSDKDYGAILLEEVIPASTCKSLVKKDKDHDATKAIAAAFIGLQHQSCKNKTFPHIRNFLSSLSNLKGKVEENLLSEAHSLLDALTLNNSEDVLLHGDLHHDNILNDNSKWTAIDPHGYIGPKGFEIGAMMRNPYDCFPKGDLNEILNDRVNTLAQTLKMPTDEIINWSFIYTMISSSWSAKDHNEVPKEHTDICKALISLR